MNLNALMNSEMTLPVQRQTIATLVGSLFIALMVVLASSVSVSQTSVIHQAPTEIAPIETPFGKLSLSRPAFPDRDFDIRTYGAIEGGTIKNTDAIRKTIEAAAASGGGRVVIPSGVWLTGAIHLESNINLYLTKGSELLFSQDYHDYLPVVFSRHEDTECYKFSAFVYAKDRTNIAITGEGTLNGQGKPWWAWKQTRKDSDARVIEMGDENMPVRERVFDGENGNFLRPAFFQPMNCTNVFVEGVTFLYGAFWTITPTYCENVIIRKVNITTVGAYGHTPNGDGVDPSSSKNVLIEYCEFNTGDDCIAIKSGRDRDGLRVNRPTENVVVRHCVGLQGHGGIVVGSETSGSVRNVYAYDCAFNGTDRIVRVKTARGRGGILENMWFEHLSADTIQQEALHINMLYTGSRYPVQPVTEVTPVIRNLHYSDISCAYARRYAIELLGLPERAIENISFDRIVMNAAKGIHCVDADSVEFKDVNITPKSWPVIDITDGRSMTFTKLAVPPGANPFLKIDGRHSFNISVVETKTGAAAKFLELGNDVSRDSIRLQ
jgi:hypothetical protein